VIIVLWLAAAYMYLVRFADRLDLDGQTLRLRCVLRRGELNVQDVTAITGTYRFTIVKVHDRRRLTVWAGLGSASSSPPFESRRRTSPDRSGLPHGDHRGH